MKNLNQSPIRVLHIVTHMNRGGLETMIMNYYRSIDKSKVQFDFLVHREQRADYDDEIETLGGKIYRLPILNPLSNHYLKSIDNFFKEHKEYKIVHSHLDCLSSIPLKYAKKNGVPFTIAHSHNSSQDKNLKYIIKLMAKRKISKYADELFACSKEAGQWMFNTDNFITLNNAINSKEYSYNEKKSKDLKEALGLSNKFVIGHVGRFFKQKNHTFIIDIFKELSQINEDAVLMLVGGGELEEEIKNKVDELGLSNKVLFLGVRDDIPDLMQVMDVFLLPSLYEGLPLVLVEAQAAGLKCVISDTISSESIITNNVKIMRLEDSINEWSKCVNNFSNYIRSNTIEDIKRSKFDIEVNVKWLQDYYTNNKVVQGGEYV